MSQDYTPTEAPDQPAIPQAHPAEEPRQPDRGQYPPSANAPIPVRPKGARAGEVVTFDLAGELFHFKLGKTYELFDLIEHLDNAPGSGSPVGDARAFRPLKAWLFDGLEDGQRERLEERLRDRDDELDIDHLLEVFQHIAQRVAGRSPT